MDIQLVTGGKSSVAPRKELMKPVHNRIAWMKPWGGLWTSTFDEEIGSEWMSWSCREDFCWPPNFGWLLTLRKRVRIATVDSEEDLHALLYRFPKSYPYGQGVYLDFERMSKYFDGMHLTTKGERETRFSRPHDLYGWDCESTVWFRWCFDKVEETDLSEIIKKVKLLHGSPYGSLEEDIRRGNLEEVKVNAL